MSDNVTVEAVKQLTNDSNRHGANLTSETVAANPADLAHWQQIMQAYYKQPQQQQPAFYPAAAHPYAWVFSLDRYTKIKLQLFAMLQALICLHGLQPLMYGSPFYGGVMPYAYPQPAAAALPGSDTAAKDDKSAAPQAFPPSAHTAGSGAAQLPTRVRPFTPRTSM